jgi:hypothetical protein
MIAAVSKSQIRGTRFKNQFILWPRAIWTPLPSLFPSAWCRFA